MFTLTREERRVILFLLTSALAGTGLNFFLKTHSGVTAVGSFNENLGRIDLNKADKTLLMNVSGIGEKIACRILDYRLSHGGFSALDELKTIKGITRIRYEKIKGSFYIE